MRVKKLLRSIRVNFNALFSNTGATAINQIALQYHLDSYERDDYEVSKFQVALANAAFNEPGGLWHTALIDRHLISFFVPFLPLERRHVRKCITHQLQLARKEDGYRYALPDKEIVARVLDLLEFAPPDKPLYAVAGCKKVQQKLDYVLESHRMKQSKFNREL